jgi:hypothetical protein
MNKRWILIAASLVLLGLIAAGTALASSGGDYVLDWYTIDGGGGSSSGGVYSLSGTIGQPDAGGMGGGNYDLSGGFWSGIIETLYKLFLPLITR